MRFVRLLAATLAIVTIFASSWALILLSFLFVLQCSGLVQAFAVMVLEISVIITTLIYWSEQGSFPFNW